MAHQQGGGRYTGVSFIDRGIGHVVNFLSDQPPKCTMPGCNKQCYVENNGHVHEFCGKTHAGQYKAMKDAERQQKMMREKRLKAVQHGGWQQGQHSYSAAAAAPAQYGSHTRSGASYGAYNVVNQPPPTMVTNHYGNMGHGQILFYNRDEPYYEFTNFYAAPIVLDGKTWPTTEHYFQAQKFIGTSYPEVIRNFDRPRQAFDLSRDPTVSRWRRSDWEEIKIAIMKKALLAKFTQHKHLRQMLLSTGDNKLIEHTPYDKFWGDGGDGSGQNHLGLLLMEIRYDLKMLQASLRQENDHAARSRINADSHRDRVQTVRSNSTEKDGSNGLSSTSSCSMDYTNAEDDKANLNNDLPRRPLHSVATENAGSPPRQQPGGEASPQVNTPLPATDTGTASSQSTSEVTNDAAVANLIDLEDHEPLKDKVTDLIAGGVPTNLDPPIKPTPPAPDQYSHTASQCTAPAAAAPDTSTGAAGKKEPSPSNEEEEEQMDTNNIH